jgi:hypothetical protein
MKNPTVIVVVFDSPGTNVNLFRELPRRWRLFDVLRSIGRTVWMWI